MEICLERETLENILIPSFPVSMLCGMPSFDPVHFGQTEVLLWTLGKHMWLLPILAQFCGALRKAFPKAGYAAVSLMIKIEMGTGLNS